MLEEAGFSREQAETSIKILLEIMEDKLATKQDLREMEIRLKADLTVRMGAMLAGTVTLLTAVITLVHRVG